MTSLAGLGVVGMLTALAWFAWCVVRVLLGPARLKALGRSGIAALAFFGSALFCGLEPDRRAGRLGNRFASAFIDPAADDDNES